MSKELLAKFGVFALIVINLGAYYMFWPSGAPHPPGENGKAIALEKQDSSGKPFSIAPSVGAPRSLSYACSPISRNGNKSVAPGCFNPEAATTTAQSGKKVRDDNDSHGRPVPPGHDATRRGCLHLR